MTGSAMSAFVSRHIGPRGSETEHMLETVGYASLDALVDAAVPSSIRMEEPLDIPEGLSEEEALAALRGLAQKNTLRVQMIGQGFYDTHTPAVIRRNIVENPGWYTAYTPYQPEISQGRLEALLNFQTMVADLTGLAIANASLLDEASAVAEAILLMRRATRAKDDALTVVDADMFPQTLNVVRGRAEALGIPLEVRDFATEGLPEGPISGIVLQQPADSGAIVNHAEIIAEAKERGAKVTIATDLLALTQLTSPGEQGADIAVGNSQRFGVPLFFGGPHAAFMAVNKGLERNLPGRLVGVSYDTEGRPAYRLSLQTREQHIRREKATSNICTAQALLAVVASMYGVYHGPEGLKAIARRTHAHACALAAGVEAAGAKLATTSFFDTVRFSADGAADSIVDAADAAGINIRRVDENTVSVSTDETTTDEHIEAVISAVCKALIANADDAISAASEAREACEGDYGKAADLVRESEFMTHPIFNSVRSETQMMRYLTRLANRDLALDRTMIPLGSCTMKLNAAAEMEAITWPEFAGIHPFAPVTQTRGWRELIADLEERLEAITGYAGVSIQPNAGSQGEYAGLLAIRQYHQSRGEADRDVCLIPASAHGTNAASAVLAGLRVVVVKTADDGSIDEADLAAKIEANQGKIAAIMITYPSTHGVFDAQVVEVCKAVHDAGGQVYIDGANMNAMVGLAQPGKFGGDVSHLNLHKTFCIPHGGGGPGVGPVAVAEHLVPFLPGPALEGREDEGLGGRDGAPITAASFGSAGVLPISWAYIAMMGPAGLGKATKHALLGANYIAARLKQAFPILYTGNAGLVAHECILDLRELTNKTGVTAEDVTKRLMDFGFHAPTLAFPVAGTLMVEPTESEDLAELDRFIDAMLTIREEIDEVADGIHSLEGSPLRNAPHTADIVTRTEWDRTYSRQQGAFPGETSLTDKYFTPVSRIDQAYGDRNLMCECPPLSAFED